MIKDLTRRQFLHTGTSAALGKALPGNMALASSLSGTLATLTGLRDEPQRAPTPVGSLIFPRPQKIAPSESHFILDDKVQILLPRAATDQDLQLAVWLRDEVADRYGCFLRIQRTADGGKGRVIVMGTATNPLVRQYGARVGLPTAGYPRLNPEGYVLRANADVVLIAGASDRGTFYGLQSLRQLVEQVGGDLRIRGVSIRDWPDKPFRGLCMYCPGRANVEYFKRFVRDFMGFYKYNTLILEMNACMRLDSHPELNHGWIEFARDVNYSDRNYPLMPFHNFEQNSSHQDAGDGGILEKEEVAELVAWVKRCQIELIPQLPSFTHSYYLLTAHKDLAAIPQNKWPDIYCPANPKSYSLLFDVYQEYIDVMKPKAVHIGHDELFLPLNASTQCQEASIGDMFGQDVRTIHDFLGARQIRTQLWGDMLLQTVRGVGLQKGSTPDGWKFDLPGGLTPEQVKRWIPKDCLIYNWFWSDEPGKKTSAEQNEEILDEMGFEQVFGNLEPTIEHYDVRKKRKSLLGGAPSAWFATNEATFGKDMMSTFLGCSGLLWTGSVVQGKALSGRVQAMLPALRTRLRGTRPPSETETSIVPVDISRAFNALELSPPFNLTLSSMRSGNLQQNRVPFELKDAAGKRAIVVGTRGQGEIDLPLAVTGVAVGEAPTSLIFLHACARPALNRGSFRMLWDQEDTADLLGWYEVIYEDNYSINIPIRYGVNLLEWGWENRVSGNDYCYGADPLTVTEGSAAGTCFIYEWENPRLGKVIREINLKSTKNFQGGSDDFNNDVGPVIASNAVLLVALSMVKKRT